MAEKLAFCRDGISAVLAGLLVCGPLAAQQQGGKASDLTAEMRSRFGNSVQHQTWSKPKVMNPSAATAKTAIETVLRRQSQVAENERSQILSMRKAGGSTDTGIKPGTTMSASTGGARSGATPATGHPAVNPGQATASSVLPEVCPPGAVPLLRTVDGEKSGVIFTPEPSNHEMISPGVSYFYTIEGCHFGTVQGQVALVGPFTHGRIDLPVDTWTDGGIVVHVPSNLSGELDQDNVTLSLTISGMPLQAPGMKFYAAREEILLNSMPAREASLGGGHLPPNFPFYQSPGFGTLDVQRNTDKSFSPASDLFSFEGLQRGFVPVAFQAEPYAPQTADQCNYMINRSGMTISFDGAWNAQWDSNHLRVDWRVSHCYAPQDSTHPAYNSWASWYGAKIWVMGPRGVNPWQPSYVYAQPPIVR
ncbi:MAG TPA: hypothetical protein VKE93_02025 [Candidatus Angelobacter sp.]|nr:hypothetical protein [Candidatus Angelobacter sp.]